MSIRIIKIVVITVVVIAGALAALQFMLTVKSGSLYGYDLGRISIENTALIAVFSSEGRYYSSGQTPWDGYYDGETLLVIDRIRGQVKVCLGNSQEIISETKEYTINQPTEISVIPVYLDCHPR